MTTVITAYFCEPEALDKLSKLFSKILKTKPKEAKIIEFMRESIRSKGRYKCKLLIIRGLSKLLNTKYCHNETAIQIIRETLKNVERNCYILIEARKVRWLPNSRHTIKIDDVNLPIANIEIEKTLQLQKDHAIKNFVIVRI